MIDIIENPVVPLEQQLIDEENISEIDEIVKAFNVNLQKKNIIRAAKLSDVQDKVVEQMAERLEQRADTFSNEDLIKYHKAIQDTLTKSDTTMDNVQAPTIMINQQVNADTVTFDRESRQRILDAVNSIIAGATKEQLGLADIPEENIELEESDE